MSEPLAGIVIVELRQIKKENRTLRLEMKGIRRNSHPGIHKTAHKLTPTHSAAMRRAPCMPRIWGFGSGRLDVDDGWLVGRRTLNVKRYRK